LHETDKKCIQNLIWWRGKMIENPLPSRAEKLKVNIQFYLSLHRRYVGGGGGVCRCLGPFIVNVAADGVSWQLHDFADLTPEGC
jgi:hypothetical protein